MSECKQDFTLYQASPSYRLLSNSLREPVEQMVTKHIHRAWKVSTFSDMNDYASHPSAILSDRSYPVFVKLSEAAHGLDQFEVELAGLKLLSEQAGALTPTPIGILSAGNRVVMVLEGVQAMERGSRQWKDIGRTLARIHQTGGSICGLERQGYFGPLYQDNRPIPDWLTFYTERRLWPRLMGAIDSGHLPTVIIRRMERLIARLPGLDIPDTRPVLLHGDAQKNNFISTSSGAVVIDPAVYYGNPEIDLAYVDYFEPVPDDVWLGYQEILPIDPGFTDRRDLWRISAYLAAIEVEGPGHLFRLTNALRKYC